LHEACQDDEANEHATKALEIAGRLDLKPQRARVLDTLASIRDDDDVRAEAEAIYKQLGISRPAGRL